MYFNPLEAVGFGITIGQEKLNKYRIGDIQYDVSVPYQSIYIPSHPFKDNQAVTFTSSTAPIKVSVKNFGALSNLPATGLYVINKGKDYIGLTTFKDHASASVAGFSTGGYFFRSFATNGDSRDWKYSLEASYTKQTARIERITANVMTGAPWEGTPVTKTTFDDGHLLLNGDEVKLTVKSNQSVGIGTSTAVRLKYNSDNDKLIVNPTTFAGSAVLAGNIINLTAHGLETGDKVFYDGGIVGLSTCLLYTSPSPRDVEESRMPASA